MVEASEIDYSSDINELEELFSKGKKGSKTTDVKVEPITA